MHTVILTLYPEMFPGPLGVGLLGRALTEKRWTLDVLNIRDFASDSHQSVDAPAFGGGAGMVLMAPVIDKALQAGAVKLRQYTERPAHIIYFSARGSLLQQQKVKHLASLHQTHPLILLCGRFEGIDQRVLDVWKVEEICVGDFILMGGEIPALATLESMLRLQEGILGNPASLEEESFQGGLLEYPHYTRPAQWNGQHVPPVLLSGHHAKIQHFRENERRRTTEKRRPDLWRIWTQEQESDRKKSNDAVKEKNRREHTTGVRGKNTESPA